MIFQTEEEGKRIFNRPPNGGGRKIFPAREMSTGGGGMRGKSFFRQRTR